MAGIDFDSNKYAENALSEEELMKQYAHAPWEIMPDYTHLRELALTEAGKLENHSVQELLQNADKIYDWMLKEKAPR